MFRQRLFDQDLQGGGHVRIARRLISRQNASVSSQIGNMLGNKLRGGHTYSPQWLFGRTYWMALSVLIFAAAHAIFAIALRL
jgi:hypothetical protein